MVAKSKKPEPTQIEPFGDNLDPNVAVIQAANALDVAAQFAEAQADSGRLLEVAQVWLIISQRLGGPGDPTELEVTDGESETQPSDKKFRMGFTAQEDEAEE